MIATSNTPFRAVILSGRVAPGRRMSGAAVHAWRALVALCLLTLALAATPLRAQTLPGTAPANVAAPAASDPYGRETPRGLADGLIDAIAGRDYTRAAKFFDLSAIPAGRREEVGAGYARQLQAALDQGGSLVPFIQLSNDPAGRLDDDLAPDEERIGRLPALGDAGEDTPLIARASTDGDVRVWRISPASIAALPATTVEAAAEQDSLRSRLPAVLTETVVFGAPLSDWLILLVMAVVYYALVRLIFAAALAIAGRRYEDRSASRVWRLLHAASAPLSLYLALLLFLISTRSLHVAIVARQLVSRFAGAVAVVALAWFLWRLIDVVVDIVAIRMDRGQRRRAKSILVFARRGVKLLLLGFGLIAALGALGIDVTTGIAALGLGGLALALGAQKTVENIVGSISVIADEPIRVGDFCRVGDVTGTVEDIGIRSTRIRTNERTRVTIPNGAFSSLQIENFSLRDRYLFNPKLNLARDLNADGVERVLEAVRGVLKDADFLFEGARVTFTGFGENSFVLEVFGWIDVPDFDRSLYLQEKLYLDIMRKVAEAGGSLAVPTAAVRIDGPPPAPPPPAPPSPSSEAR